jgi:hypothetical protein
MTTLVCARMLPSKTALAPTETVPATAQMMFDERAPPVRVMCTLGAWVRVPEIWKIQAGAAELINEEVQDKTENGRGWDGYMYVLSAGPPAMVMAVEMLTAVVHLYKPGVRIEPPMRPK